MDSDAAGRQDHTGSALVVVVILISMVALLCPCLLVAYLRWRKKLKDLRSGIIAKKSLAGETQATYSGLRVCSAASDPPTDNNFDLPIEDPPTDNNFDLPIEDNSDLPSDNQD